MSRAYLIRLTLAVISTLIAIPLAMSQQPGQRQGGNVPSPQPTTPGTPGTTTPTPGPRDRTQMPQPGEQRTPFPETQRPIFLSGKVVLDDGSPPPDSVVIERVCNGMPRPETYTDSKGRFSFQLGQNLAMMQDASVSSAADTGFGTPGGVFGQPPRGAGGGFGGGLGNNRGFSERDLMGCELRANLPGYRSDVVNLSGRRMFDNPDVGTIILHRLGNVEGTTISMTSLQAPKDAKKAFDKGREALKRKKTADAQKDFEKAVEIYPKYAVAWYELGLIHEQQNQPQDARQAYNQALAADSRFVNPYRRLAVLAMKEQNWQEAADTSDRMLKLNPLDFPDAFFYNAVANYNLKKFDAAEKSAREAQRLDKLHRIPKVDQVLGVILAQKQDFAGAAEQMKSYLKFAPNAEDAEMVRKQLSELERLSGSSASVKEDK